MYNVSNEFLCLETKLTQRSASINRIHDSPTSYLHFSVFRNDEGKVCDQLTDVHIIG